MSLVEIRQALVAVPSVNPLAAAPRRALSFWSPSLPTGPYTLPREILERLTGALQDFRNRDAAIALAVFLGRFWSSEKCLVIAFPIDRRALTDHPALGLTEARVRGAIAVLKKVGFLEPEPPQGSNYKPTETGLHRKPILWRFGSEYGVMFVKANARSKAAREARGARRAIVPSLPAAQRVEASRAQLAQRHRLPAREVLMGDRPELEPGLAAVFARWGKAIEERGGDG